MAGEPDGKGLVPGQGAAATGWYDSAASKEVSTFSQGGPILRDPRILRRCRLSRCLRNAARRHAGALTRGSPPRLLQANLSDVAHRGFRRFENARGVVRAFNGLVIVPIELH